MLEKLFEKVNSELLTDEIKLELSTIFESQLNEAIAAKEQELEEGNATEIAEFKDEMITKLDEYLAYFVEEFTKEQEDQIVESVKVERATEILETFDTMVKSFNMQLSEESLEESADLEEAKTKLSEQTETIINLRKEVEGMQVAQIVEAKASEFDVDTEKEKFRKLAETVTFGGDVEEFTSKIDVIAESIKDSKEEPHAELEEEEVEGEGDQLEEAQELKESSKSSTQRYMKYLSR